MKKIGVVTYCEWHSYGSVLQTIGLKRALGKLGCDSVLIKSESKQASEYRFKFFEFKRKCMKEIISKCYQFFIKDKILRKYKKSIEFIDQNVDIEYYNNYSELQKNPVKVDAFIAGSDQIWHPDLCKPLFFLDFVSDSSKKISYAASMGKTVIPTEKEEDFKSLINNIDRISVREEDNVEVICRYTDKRIDVNIDPTFLCTADSWRGLQKEYTLKKPYILVYAIYWNPDLNKQLKSLKKETGCEIVSISSGLNRVYADKYIFDAHPGEFLWLVDNAEYVVTSSFHGVAFSTIFNKPFAAVINPLLPSRISSLLDCLNIPLIGISELPKQKHKIDYEKINNNIRLEREKSFNYLSEALFNNE